MNRALNFLKAHTGLLFAVAAWYIANYANTPDARWVSLGVAAATWLGVAVVPNAALQGEVDTVLDHTFPDPAARADAGYTLVEVMIALILLAVFLFLIFAVVVPAAHH